MSETRVALVTGASRGIGRAIGVELARRGYIIAVNYKGNEQSARDAMNIISAEGGKAEVFQADVGDETEVKRLFSEIRDSLGDISVLVNNAGVTKPSLLMRMKTEDWDSVISTNLKSAFLCSKEAVRFMIKSHWGRIVNISSVAGLIGDVGQANYSAAKAGVMGFTKALAREVAQRNITVNSVAPGLINTDMTKSVTDEYKRMVTEQIPLKRMGTPEDISKLVAFLCSDDAGYITGQVINVDGGFVMC